jgi:hypothetical protein
MKQFQKEQKIVEAHILANQTILINKLLETKVLSSDEIENSPYYDEDDKEIFEWWLIDEWLLNKLRSKNESVLSVHFNNWWGRSCTGQAIYLDSVISEIAAEIYY